MLQQSQVVNAGWVLNPALVEAHRQGLVKRPLITSAAVMTAFSRVKPGQVVDEDTATMIRDGINVDTHPGEVAVKNGASLPVFVRWPTATSTAPTKVEPKKPKGAENRFMVSLRQVRDLVSAVMARRRIDYGAWNDGLKECAVHANSVGGEACLCGGWHKPEDMRGYRLDESRALAIGDRCAYALSIAGVVLPDAFTDMVDVHPSTQTKGEGSRTKLPIQSIEDFAVHVRAGRYLSFSRQPAIGAPIPCTLTVNGRGICACEGTGDVRRMFALQVGTKCFPIGVACAGRLLGIDPDIDITDYSFAQAMGWGDDFGPVTEDVRTHVHAEGYNTGTPRPKRRTTKKGQGARAREADAKAKAKSKGGKRSKK